MTEQSSVWACLSGESTWDTILYVKGLDSSGLTLTNIIISSGSINMLPEPGPVQVVGEMKRIIKEWNCFK